MIASGFRPRRIAIALAGLIAAMIILPLASLLIAALFESWRLRGQDNYSISIMLIKSIEARAPKGLVLAYPLPLRLPDCEIDPDTLADWTEGEDRFWAQWGPSYAIHVSNDVFRAHYERLSGEDALQTRYIDNHSSDFERRFLLGCINGTPFAAACAWRVKAMMAAERTAAMPPDVARRREDQERWAKKTLCALARGLAQEKAPAAPHAQDRGIRR